MKIHNAARNIISLDELAGVDSVIHRIDPRAKVFAILLFIVTATSFPKYELAGLMPLFLYIVVMAELGRIPWKILLQYLAFASPFALLVGIFNPLIDERIIVQVGNIGISGGWISFISIILKFLATTSAALMLIASTGYVSICNALGRMGMPRILVVQFLFIFRFIFILIDEASRMSRAYTLRATSDKGVVLHIWGSLAGHLLLRAYDRGQRLYTAMLARGFEGEIKSSKTSIWKDSDTLFIILSLAFFALIRFGNIVQAIGSIALGGMA